MPCLPAAQSSVRRWSRCVWHISGALPRSHAAAMKNLFGGDPQGKICRLLDFSKHPRDIDDPWYTGDFATAYRDIAEGCEALLDRLFPGSGRNRQ